MDKIKIVKGIKYFVIRENTNGYYLERAKNRLSTELITLSQKLRIKVFGCIFQFLSKLDDKLIWKNWWTRDQIYIFKNGRTK